MKFLKLSIFLLISYTGSSQYTNIHNPTKWDKGGFDNLFLPVSDTITPSDTGKAWIVYKAPILYVWNGGKWAAASSGSGGGGGTVGSGTTDTSTTNPVFIRDTTYLSGKDFGDSGTRTNPITVRRYNNRYIDSLFATIITGGSGGFQNGLIKPGYVTYSGSGYTFDVTDAVYYIGGVQYTSAANEVTLNAADGALDRIDVIAVDINGNVVSVTGTPGSNPIEPQIDPATQVKLTAVTVTAGSTAPNINTTTIYNEHTFGEYAVTSNGVSINADYNSVPGFSGGKSINVGGWTSGNTITFTNSVYANSTSYTYFKMFVKLKSVVTDYSSISVTFYKDNVPVSKTLSIVSYGIIKTSVGNYQNVSVPMGAFGFTSNTFNKVQVRFGGANADGLFIDYVQFQNVDVTPSSGIYLTDIYADSATKKVYKVIGGQNVYAGFTVGTSSGGGGTPLTLTTNFTSGAATYNSSTGVLNIPQYTGGGGTGSGWNLNGNSINPASDFLGTTSNNSLRIKTNNIQRVSIDSTGRITFIANNGSNTIFDNLTGRWGVGTLAPTADFDVGTIYARNYIQSPVYRGENISSSGSAFDFSNNITLGVGNGLTANQFIVSNNFGVGNSGVVNGFNMKPTTTASTGGDFTTNYFNVNPTLNYSGTVTNSRVRGYYYNPTLTSTTGLTNIAFESTSGLIILRNLPVFTSNAAALSALGPDAVYRNGDDLKITH